MSVKVNICWAPSAPTPSKTLGPENSFSVWLN